MPRNTNPCYDEFSFISEWTDTNPIHISNYIQWAETKGNSNNKSRMKITEMEYNYGYQNVQFNCATCRPLGDGLVRLSELCDIFC